MLAQQNIYLKTAYEKLEEISANQQKRLAYTARQKALYDYNTLVEENYERGVDDGIQQGKLERDVELIQRMRAKGMSNEEIEQILGYKIS